MRDVRAILGGVPGFETASVRAGLSDGPTNASYRVERGGADFVLLGRAFYMAVAAIGAPGAAHAIHVLSEELKITMGQLGARRPADLPGFLG